MHKPACYILIKAPAPHSERTRPNNGEQRREAQQASLPCHPCPDSTRYMHYNHLGASDSAELLAPTCGAPHGTRRPPQVPSAQDHWLLPPCPGWQVPYQSQDGKALAHLCSSGAYGLMSGVPQCTCAPASATHPAITEPSAAQTGLLQAHQERHSVGPSTLLLTQGRHTFSMKICLCVCAQLGADKANVHAVYQSYFELRPGLTRVHKMLEIGKALSFHHHSLPCSQSYFVSVRHTHTHTHTYTHTHTHTHACMHVGMPHFPCI